MIYDAKGNPVRQDCTVEVNRIEAVGRNFGQDYMKFEMKDGFQKRMVTILKEHGGTMSYQDFLKEYRRRYPNE